MTPVQPELDFPPAAPIAGETEATVDLVAGDWRADEDWRRFEAACRAVALHWGNGNVNPNDVRVALTRHGELTISPRRLSAFYHRAAGKAGFLDFSHWGISDDHKGRNAGKPCRIYRLRT
jgi:hypothetical protein